MLVASTNSAILIGMCIIAERLTGLTLCSEEQKPLEDFFQAKNLKVRNEMLDDVSLAIVPPVGHTDLYSERHSSSCPQ